jgi:hypothetical protein
MKVDRSDVKKTRLEFEDMKMKIELNKIEFAKIRKEMAEL